MQGSYLGPSFTNDEIEQTLQKLEANYERLDDSVWYVIGWPGIWRMRKSLAGCRGGWSLGPDRIGRTEYFR